MSDSRKAAANSARVVRDEAGEALKSAISDLQGLVFEQGLPINDSAVETAVGRFKSGLADYGRADRFYRQMTA